MEISLAVAARPNVRPEEELRMAVLADRLGYSELWVGEGWIWDSFVLATAIGMATEQIAITVGPLPVHVRDPATIARAAASTAALVRRPVGVALGHRACGWSKGCMAARAVALCARWPRAPRLYAASSATGRRTSTAKSSRPT